MCDTNLCMFFLNSFLGIQHSQYIFKNRMWKKKNQSMEEANNINKEWNVVNSEIVLANIDFGMRQLWYLKLLTQPFSFNFIFIQHSQ